MIIKILFYLLYLQIGGLKLEVLYVKEKGKDRKSEIINIEEFILLKVKNLGNKLTNKKIKEVKWLDPLPFTQVEEVNEDQEELEMKIQESRS